MKNLFSKSIPIILSSLLLFSSAFATEYSDEMLVEEVIERASNKYRYEKYFLAADFYDYKMYDYKMKPLVVITSEDCKEIWYGHTWIVSYDGDFDGSLILQTCWYADGFTITHLKGHEKGKQIVVFNGNIIGISFPHELYYGDILHRYAWGTVRTRHDYQRIEIENFHLFKANEPENDTSIIPPPCP